MGVRQENYWMRQADALARQNIANTAFAISIAMAEKDDRQKALDSLELTQTAGSAKKQLAENAWALMAMLPNKGGKGV